MKSMVPSLRKGSLLLVTGIHWQSSVEHDGGRAPSNPTSPTACSYVHPFHACVWVLWLMGLMDKSLH